MKIAKTNILRKTNSAITTAVRNTSCNRGWLQIFTHIVCGTFTVTSFVLILLVTLQIFPIRRPREDSRCHDTGCRVICYEAPYYDEYEDDIILAVTEAETHCQSVFLTLNEPAFTNETMPKNWLSRLRPNVIELSVIGGNLRYIPPDAFSCAFARQVKILLLENITISEWNSRMLLGLTNLENVILNNCDILEIQDNALSSVSATLESLTVMQSGYWDPLLLTGTFHSAPLSKLTTVDFSYNRFGSILRNSSFTRLPFCKSLFLSSSRITHIGSGTFDNLNSIEYLNLDNNFLISIAPGLFTKVISKDNVRIRLNLIDNPWHCDCAVRDLRQLVRKNVLIVDPVCQSPENLSGKTFTEFNKYCRSKEPRKIEFQPRILNVNEEETMHSIDCENGTPPWNKFQPVLISPFHDYQCSTSKINTSNLPTPTMAIDYYDKSGYFWIKPTLILRGTNFTMVELGSSGLEGYGLIWYLSSCPNEVYCVNVVPEIIRLYNLNISNQYVFCPIMLTSGIVENNQCIAYSSTVIPERKRSVSQVLMYMLIAITCLFFGAVFLYFLIRKYPYLLKGSKRLLFVKHKSVDALVLPPKVPLRSSMLNDNSLVQFNDMRNTAETLRTDFVIGQLARSQSTRSNHSVAPSYISALQPTEEQLADWRLRHGDDKFESNYAPISTISSEMAPISIVSGSDNLYFSLDISSQSSIVTGNSVNHSFEKQSITLF